MFSHDPILAAIEFGSQEWTWPIVGIIAFATLLLSLSYRSATQPVGFKLALSLLKVCGISLIALCLLNPRLIRNHIRPGENIIVLLADNSSSMQIADHEGETRFNQYRQLIQQDRNEWLTRLTQDFDLRRYAFDERINQFEDDTSLTFDGNRSQLASALASLVQRFRNQPLAAILVMTDGNASDLEVLRELDWPIPVYPVVTASEEHPLFDIALLQLSVTESPFEDAPITISAAISSTASEEIKVVVRLSAESPLPDSGQLEQTILIPAGGQSSVRFQLKPEELGIKFYHLQAIPEAEIDALENSELSSEATLANNERLLTIDRGHTKHRILYLGGRPNWEYKFFNRAVGEDRQVDLVSLIRIAPKEAKFDFRGRVGENSNSLFRGQERDVDAGTESFDQSVMIRLNTRDAAELSGGFPKSKKELYEYDAIILDDIEAAFFTPDQQTLIDRFVAERGGGLLMLGGRDSYRHGQWQKTPLRDVLPVYLDRIGENPQGKLRWELTREGWLEPWMRVRPTEAEEQQRLAIAPDLEILNSTADTKPGSRIFAELRDESGTQFPAVVAQQYGRGRSAAVLVGDLWRWSIQREDPHQDDLAKSWRQMIRWLVAEVPQKLETELNWTQIGNVPAVQFQVRIRDEEYQPRENSTVSLAITAPGAAPLQISAEPSLTEAGLFEALYVPRDEGSYLAEVTVTNGADPLPQTMKIGWTLQPDEAEFQQIEVNREALTEIANRSHGEVIEISDLPNFVRELPQKEMPITEVKSTPLWHSPYILLMALACLAAEWGLRRWRGLP